MKNNKSLGNTFLYMPVPISLLSATSLLQLMDVSKADLYYYFAVLLAIILGFLHIIVIDKFLYPRSTDQIASVWLSILIMFFSAVIIIIIYYYAGLNIQFMTFIISFIIPYICLHAYRYFLQILSTSKRNI